MKNINKHNSLSETPNFEFIESDQNEYGFAIKAPGEGFELLTQEIDPTNGYLYLSFWNKTTDVSKNFIFDKDRNHISLKQIEKEFEGNIETQNIGNSYIVERVRKVNHEEGYEYYEDTLFFNNEKILQHTSLAGGNYSIPITKIYDFYIEQQEKSKIKDEKQKEYNQMSDDEKIGHLIYLIQPMDRPMKDGINIKLSILRATEPEIEKYFDKLVKEIEEALSIKKEKNQTSAQFMSYFIDFNEEVKTETIEGVDISFEDLSEKVGDLFYDSLSYFLDELGDQLEQRAKPYQYALRDRKNKAIKNASINLKEASKNIMTAWEICKPYISYDFPVMKHTTEVKGLDLDRTTLAQSTGNLLDENLGNFLKLLSEKIHRDGEADEGRGRKKLANELFECSKKLANASELINE